MRPARRFGLGLYGTMAFLVLAWPALIQAAVAPYNPDAATLHLWHLDESAPPNADTSPGGTNLTELANGATLYHTSHPGFGTALSTIDGGQGATTTLSQKDALLTPRPLASGTADDTAITLADPVSGAFTFEAMVRVDYNPALNLSARATALQILSGEGDGNLDRVFQWRLDPVGIAAGVASDTAMPRLEFINLRQAAAVQNIAVAIPTNGPHAIVSNGWFHVAITYDGNENTLDNLRFYWTSLTGAATAANLIGTASLADDLTVAPCDFVIGNEGRSTGGSDGNWLGLIDEVRLSSIARATNEFVFRSVLVLEASGYEAGTTNFPANTRDGNFNSRWSAFGDGQWIAYDLGRSELVQSVAVAFYLGNVRTTTFDVLLSGDNVSWVAAATNVVSSGLTLALETFDFPDFPARYVRLVGHGNSQSLWNSLTEVTIQSAPASDSDGDGLPDDWEAFYFLSLTQTATNDFDLDTFDNLAEYIAGSNPTNTLSTPLDRDADGLPDAWEQTYFGSLAQTAEGDFDGDGRSNLAEYLAGENPASPPFIPAGLMVNYVPIEDGNTNTSEYGYAGSSSINTVNFVHNALHTENGQQFIAYYYRHATSASDPNNNRIVIARRSINTNRWEMFFTTFTANAITDGHDVAAFGIDGSGVMHLSWGMHGDAFHYAKTTTSVFGTNAIVFGPDTTMTGRENGVTYPQWLRLPGGDLLYLFREGASGNGDTFLNRYYVASQTWSNVHISASTQLPFLKGTGWSPNYNAYPNMPQLDADGNFHLVWTWRYSSGSDDSQANPKESGYQTNHDFDYARSTNGGLTWIRQSGVPYALPISQSGESGDPNTKAERILSVAEGYSLINQAGMCLDTNHSPVIATWWAPGTGTNCMTNTWWVAGMGTNNFRRQYMVAFRDANGIWQARQVSNRTNDPVSTKYAEANVRNLGRPVVVCDPVGRLIVLYRDNAGSNGLTIVHSLPYAIDPQRTNWTTFDLTTANLGNYEPVIDEARWELDQNLQIVYQPSEGQGYAAPVNLAAQIGVVEWNAAAYFAHRPPLQMGLTNQNRDAVFAWNSQIGWGYRLWASTDLSSWSQVMTTNGTGGALQFIQTNATSLPQRFWRLEIKEGGFGP